MNLANATEIVPLEKDTNGVIRISKTRVTLDVVLTAFNQGATAEEIVCQFPTLQLADVYAVISYYLRQRKEVDAYLHHRQELADHVQLQNLARFELHGIRSRLLARQAKQKK